jgi:hypothetical protein
MNAEEFHRTRKFADTPFGRIAYVERGYYAGGYSSYCGRLSVIVCQGAFEPTKM